jgi:hypothetical protein
MLPAVEPSIARDKNTSHSVFDAASSRNPASVPAWLINSSGRLPYRSESRPISGPDTNWHTAYVDTSSPTTCGDAPSRSAKNGSSGKMIVKPNTSTHTIRKMGSSRELNTRGSYDGIRSAARASTAPLTTPMSDQLYLTCWLRGWSGPSMLPAYERLLRLFPFSPLACQPSTFKVLALDFASPALFERSWPPPPPIDSVLEAAREFLHPDGAFELETWWDLWQFDADWAIAPARIRLAAFGPQFDSGLSGHLRIEFGLDAHFLPRPGLPDQLKMIQSNVRSLLKLAHDIDDVLRPERRRLWSESGEDFTLRLRHALEETGR